MPAGGRVILVDDFERADGSAEKDGIGNGWETNSASRAKGHKQVTLKNGAMYIATHAEANHGASVRHDAAFTDGSLELRFMLEHDGDTLGLDFADLQCKEVHAGHLFKVAVGTKKLEIDYSYTNVPIYALRLPGVDQVVPKPRPLYSASVETPAAKFSTLASGG